MQEKNHATINAHNQDYMERSGICTNLRGGGSQKYSQSAYRSADGRSQSFVSVVTPVDAARAGALNRLPALCAYLAERFCDFEVLVLVKKDAQASCAKVFDAMLKAVPSVRYLQLSGNVPDDVAFAAGLENAIGDFIVMMRLDCDPLDTVGRAVDLCRQGNDVIVGTAPAKSTFMYRAVRPLVTWLLRCIDYRLPHNATQFRCLSRRAANAAMETGRHYQQLAMQIQNSGYPCAEMPYTLLADESGGKRRVKSLHSGLRETLRLMVFNSAAPLRLVSLLGLAGSGFACLISLFALLVRLFKDDVAVGWASTVLIISFFSFLQFIILTFLSEYVGRILTEMRDREKYAIVFERNSLTMINQDRINVLAESEGTEVNLVQTGRDR